MEFSLGLQTLPRMIYVLGLQRLDILPRTTIIMTNEFILAEPNLVKWRGAALLYYNILLY